LKSNSRVSILILGWVCRRARVGVQGREDGVVALEALGGRGAVVDRRGHLRPHEGNLRRRRTCSSKLFMTILKLFEILVYDFVLHSTVDEAVI